MGAQLWTCRARNLAIGRLALRALGTGDTRGRAARERARFAA